MKPDRWKDITRIYGAVAARPVADRAKAIEELCGADGELRGEIESLLADEDGSSLLDRPAGDRPSIMALTNQVTVGSTIGAFQITGLLGVGGMGEVYRARDTKLNRDVAIKILPPEFASDPDRLARFKREAQVLASLNHPNIAAIYGLEEGREAQEGRTLAIVMELVEGPTLADMLQPGAGRSLKPGARSLPVSESLAIARQIADALEAAHEQGVVHRDLKPANIKVREDGTVKVLDFGLAKIAEAGGAGTAGGAGDNLTQSPTITTPAMTAAGMILGTAAYMSPEQAKGRPADRRSDIWAFGCVLYEMLSGRRPFEGEDISDTLAAILRTEPDWSRLPADTPAAIRTLIEQCLTKDLAKRPSHIAVVKFLLTQPAGDTGREPLVREIPPSRRRFGWTLGIGAALLAAAIAVGVQIGLRSRPSDHPIVSRFTINLPDAIIGAGTRPLMAFSRDGSQIVYAANGRLYLRTLSELQPKPIAGTEMKEGINSPVFSPDGRWIVFYSNADRAIKRVEVTGGTATTVCEATTPFGISWDDDWLVYGEARNGIMRVPWSGGKPERLVAVNPDEIPDSPQILPGGQDVLFGVGKGLGQDRERWDKATVVVQSLKTGVRTTLVQGASAARYVPSGHLLFGVSGTLYAVPLDLRQMRIVGTPTPVVEGVRRSISAGGGVAHFSVADNGSLVYLRGAVRPFSSRSLTIVERGGKATPLPLPAGRYEHPRVSPDGTHLALETDEGSDANIWVYDLSATASLRRLTFGGHNRLPIWSSDSKRVAFQSDREGDAGLFAQRADGAGGGVAERLTMAAPGESHIPESWSPDGRTLLFSVQKDDRYSLRALTLVDQTIKPFGHIESGEPTDATFSPDGHWVVYSSNQTAGGTNSTDRGVYVQPFPDTGERYQIPKERLDFHPSWASPSEIVYTPTVGRFSAVSVQLRPSVVFGRPMAIPMPMSHDRVSTDTRDYDVLPDRRLLVTSAGGDQGPVLTDAASQLTVVLNWFEELRTRVPIKP